VSGVWPSPPTGRKTDRTATVLLGSATAWSVAVLIAADLLPIETVDTGQPGTLPRFSLVHMHGYAVLLPASIPLVVCLLVWALLAPSLKRHQWAVVSAWVASIALTATALAGTITFLIGGFVLPIGSLLVAACAQRPARPTSSDIPERPPQTAAPRPGRS
jgi:hypothetical protein